MGTRADFYVGTDQETMEWLGSIGWDGYPDGLGDSKIFDAVSEDDFRKLIVEYSKTCDDWVDPSEGWPWPWKDSGTTDYAYAFDTETDRVVAACYGIGWLPPEEVTSAYEEDDSQPVDFPDMSDRKNVMLTKRSVAD
jgi:hypothetical protein